MMILGNLHLIKYLARNIKPSIKPSPSQQQKPKQKIKFTEQQLAQMSKPNKNLRRPVQQILKSKFNKKSQKTEETLQTKYQKILKHTKKEKFNNISVGLSLQKQDRIKVQEATLDDLTKIKLDVQYLPINYLRKVQKIFNKYDQTQLREIAFNFSKLMSLRYQQEKINYQEYNNLAFGKIQEKLPKERQVQQIYLIGESKIYEEREYKSKRRIEQDPANPQISYSQNVVISYLLNRVPRTFATAVRVMSQIKYKFPNFKPKSMIDFGSGLSSGSYAFIDVFEDTGQVFNVEPNSKMRKLSKYLTDQTKIQHYQSLGQLSQSVKHVDIVYMGYLLTQLRSEMVEIYLEALHTKTKPGGLIVIVEYGSPFGSRLINETRKWSLKKGCRIVAPCPHQLTCPLSSGNQWCHFDQEAGMYSKSIFGRLPTDNSTKNQKFSYLIIKKSQTTSVDGEQHLELKENITEQWDRIIFPTMKRGKHIIMNLCTKSGTFERRVIAKSHGQQYKKAKKLHWGDLWRFGKRIPNKYRKERKTGKRLW